MNTLVCKNIVILFLHLNILQYPFTPRNRKDAIAYSLHHTGLLGAQRAVAQRIQQGDHLGSASVTTNAQEMVLH